MALKLRDLAANPFSWLALAIVSLFFHGWWCWAIRDGGPLCRCGATWVIFAGAIIARPVIRIGYAKWFDNLRKIDFGSALPDTAEIEADRQSDRDQTCVMVVGPILGVLGTILAAYGDLLAKAVLVAVGRGP